MADELTKERFCVDAAVKGFHAYLQGMQDLT